MSRAKKTLKQKRSKKPSRSPSRSAKVSRESRQPRQPSKKDAAFTIEAVGHVAPTQAEVLTPQDEGLFRSFQSNLLSLVSHELRTPLTGILNSINLLEESIRDRSSMDEGGFNVEELVAMAKRNAQRFHHTLATLLDLASMESGTFHVRLKEADLMRVFDRHFNRLKPLVEETGATLTVHHADASPDRNSEHPVLIDPQKMGRVADLSLQLILSHQSPRTGIEAQITSNAIQFEFEIQRQHLEDWKTSWMEAVAGVEAGLTSPASAFSSTIKSEDRFLTRAREGLGNELLMIYEIIRRHQGEMAYEVKGHKISFKISLPFLSSIDSIRAVLLGRIYEHSTDLGSVALGMVQVPKEQSLEDFRTNVRKCLSRASDAVYSLPSKNRIAIVLNDCKPDDAPRLLKRIERTLGFRIHFGVVICPEEGTDPELLISLAERRLGASLSETTSR